MSHFDADFICRATGGRREGPPFVVERVAKDTREDLRGALYVALVGQRFDGHDFLGAAVEAGAVAAMIDEAHAAARPAAGPVVVVADTQRALLDLAQAHLARSGARRVALTGSNGKTTTKEMIAAVCRAAFGHAAVHVTSGNLNNLIGLPLTALALQPEARVAVLEMGMSAPGEIAAMAAAARPHVGLITNVHPAHLQGLGSVEAVARAKGELFDALDAEAVAVVNLDDPRCVQLASALTCRRLGFGRDPAAQARLLQFEADLDGQTLRLRLLGRELEVHIPHAGAHNALNAAAAAAVGVALALEPDQIAAGLARAPVVPGRLTLRQLGGVAVIDDTYNANPASMQAALDVVAARRARGKTFLALGEMRELGPEAEALHAALGRAAAALAPDGVWFCGTWAEAARAGALAAGLAPGRVVAVADAAEVAPQIAAAVSAGDVLLVKGSRGARMERVVSAVAEAAARTRGEA